MADDKKKPKYVMVSYGTKTRVVEVGTDLILRTLDTRGEAANFLAELDPPKRRKDVHDN